jgi:hypothetical protein
VPAHTSRAAHDCTASGYQAARRAAGGITSRLARGLTSGVSSRVTGCFACGIARGIAGRIAKSRRGGPNRGGLPQALGRSTYW